MAEESKIDEPEFVSFSDRMAQATEDGIKEAADKEKASQRQRYHMSDKESEFAKAIFALSENPAFKTYLEFESFEIAERLTNGFRQPTESEFPSRVFAEQMAFNAGRAYQMRHLSNLRKSITSTYLSILKSQKDGGSDGQN